MSDRSNRVANALRALGVKRGDRVLLMLGNVIPLWDLMLATMKLGAVMIPATSLLTTNDLRDRFTRGRVRHVVTAAADGMVVAAASRGGYGNAVEIRHGGSVTTLYAHLSGFARGIQAGARVRQGDPVGYVGATGYATGPHLHYEVHVKGRPVDPLKYVLPDGVVTD